MAHITSLPPEISNWIITLSVIEEQHINVKPATLLRDQPSIPAFPQSPALASTCKTLQKLVLPIYYGQNTWRVVSAEEGIAWIRRVQSLSSELAVRKLLLGKTGVAWLYSFSVDEDTSGLHLKLCSVLEQILRAEYRVSLLSYVDEVNQGTTTCSGRADDKMAAVLGWMVADRQASVQAVKDKSQPACCDDVRSRHSHATACGQDRAHASPNAESE